MSSSSSSPSRSFSRPVVLSSDDDDGEVFFRHAPTPQTKRKATHVEKETENSQKTSKSTKKSKSSSSSSSSPFVVPSSPSVVLLPVESLGRSLTSSSSSPPTSLSSLNLPNVRMDVKNLEETDVRKQIEQIVINSLDSILKGDGFSYGVPSRQSANQLYVSQIDRFVLKDAVSTRTFASLRNGRKTAITTRILQLVYELCCKGIHVTKRDLFYTDVKLFTSQTESDAVIDDVATMVGCTRSSLNVVAAEKGIVVGRIHFYDDGDPIDCTRQGVGGKAIPPSIDRVSRITGDAKFVLLVEKDAAFMRLAEDRFYNTYPCVIITGKGQPDVATRLFVKRVKETLKIPVLALMDADPYGLKILSVYMTGSKNMSYDSANLTTRDIKWLGVRPTDLEKYKIPSACRLPMTEHDIKFGKELLEEDFIKKNTQWERELRMMIETKEKAEIQALSSYGFLYLTQTYLPMKLAQGDWI